jgi:hypothetical protein
MTYAFRPENWPAFQHELRARGIAVSDIERVAIRPRTVQGAADVSAGMIDVHGDRSVGSSRDVEPAASGGGLIAEDRPPSTSTSLPTSALSQYNGVSRTD